MYKHVLIVLHVLNVIQILYAYSTCLLNKMHASHSTPVFLKLLLYRTLVANTCCVKHIDKNKLMDHLKTRCNITYVAKLATVNLLLLVLELIGYNNVIMRLYKQRLITKEHIRSKECAFNF